MALKKAELSDEVILRMVEMDGRPQQRVVVKFAGAIAAAREVNGQELPVAGYPTVTNGTLVTSFTGDQPRTFALKLTGATAKAARPRPFNSPDETNPRERSSPRPTRNVEACAELIGDPPKAMIAAVSNAARLIDHRRPNAAPARC